MFCLPVLSPKATNCLSRQIRWRAMEYKQPAITIAAGRVKIHARAMARTVLHCSPDPLAAIVPATPLERIWVVETGSP